MINKAKHRIWILSNVLLQFAFVNTMLKILNMQEIVRVPVDANYKSSEFNPYFYFKFN